MSIMCRDYKRPCIYKTLWGQSRKSKLFLDQTKTTCLAQHKVYYPRQAGMWLQNNIAGDGIFQTGEL